MDIIRRKAYAKINLGLDVIRRRVLDMSPLPVGSVPVYQAAIETIREEGTYVDLDVVYRLENEINHDNFELEDNGTIYL